MSDPFDDPYYMPPADIAGDAARAYEEKIVELMNEQMSRWSGPVTFTSIRLQGHRPDTEIIIEYVDARQPGRRLANRTLLWRDPTYGCWPRDDTPGLSGTLDSAVAVSAAIGSAWVAGELELVE